MLCFAALQLCSLARSSTVSNHQDAQNKWSPTGHHLNFCPSRAALCLCASLSLILPPLLCPICTGRARRRPDSWWAPSPHFCTVTNCPGGANSHCQRGASGGKFQISRLTSAALSTGAHRPMRSTQVARSVAINYRQTRCQARSFGTANPKVGLLVYYARRAMYDARSGLCDGAHNAANGRLNWPAEARAS